MPQPQTVAPPPYSPAVTGGYGYKPEPQQVGRVAAFLSTYQAEKKFDRVVVIPDSNWDQASKDFKLPATSARIAFSLPDAKVAYINSKLFDSKSPDHGPEWALAHELEHLNDWRNPAEQEQMDVRIDASARQRLAAWKDKNPGAKKK